MVGGQPPPPDPNETPSGIVTTSDQAHKEETQKAEARVQDQQQPTFNTSRLSEESRPSSSSSGYIQYFRKKFHILKAEKGDRQKLNDASLQKGEELSRDLYNTRINMVALVAERRRNSIEEGHRASQRNLLGEATRKSPRVASLEEKRHSTSRLGRIEEMRRAIETRAPQLGGLSVPTSESHEEETRTAGDQVGVPEVREQVQRRNPLGEAPRKSARIASLEEKRQSTSRLGRIEKLRRIVETLEHEKKELKMLNDELVQEKKSLSFELKQLRRAVEIGKRDREDLQDLNNKLVQKTLELSGELNSQGENAEQTRHNGQVQEEDREDLQKRNDDLVQKERLSRKVDSQREGSEQFHQQLRQCEDEKVDLHNCIHELFQKNERLSRELKQFHLDVQTSVHILEQEREDLQKLNDGLVQEKEILLLELKSQKENAEQFRQAVQILKQEKEDRQSLNNMILETSERLSIQIYSILSLQLNSQTENAEASPERGQSLENKLKDVTFQKLVSSIRELKDEVKLLTTLQLHEAANRDLRKKNCDLHKKNDRSRETKIFWN